MYLYLLCSKDEALDAFKVFKVEMEKQYGKQTKIVIFDRGGEYYGRHTENGQAPSHLQNFLKNMGLLPNTLCLTTPYILNQDPTKNFLKTPFELLKGWKPIRIYNPQEKKLNPRTISGYFIERDEKSKRYIFYCSTHRTRIVESKNAKFVKNNLISGSDQFQDIVNENNHY
ncbi:hypothetical protein CR513_28683, partial [Mucuna pruriens]